jgi:hypothetical protein
MKHASTSRIKEKLIGLEQSLNDIQSRCENSCQDYSVQAYFRLASGTAQLESMHHSSDEFRNVIIDLHSRYINAFEVVFQIIHQKSKSL